MNAPSPSSPSTDKERNRYSPSQRDTNYWDREKFERRIQGKGKRSHMPSDKKKVQELMKRFGKEVE